MRFFLPVLMYILTLRSVVVSLQMDFRDSCDYTKFENQSFPNNKYLCGDLCLNWNETCGCGGHTIPKSRRWDDEGFKYCCSPVSRPCRKIESGRRAGGTCDVGNVLKKNSLIPCIETGFCYNDYLTSEHLGRYTRYTIEKFDLSSEFQSLVLKGHLCETFHPKK